MRGFFLSKPLLASPPPPTPFLFPSPPPRVVPAPLCAQGVQATMDEGSKRKEMADPTDTGADAKKRRTLEWSFVTPDGADIFELKGRVTHKRTVGPKLYYLDCVTVPDNNDGARRTADDACMARYEVCVCEESMGADKLAFNHHFSTPKNVKLGDLIHVRGYVDTVNPQPRPPKTVLVKALDFCIAEPFETLNKHDACIMDSTQKEKLQFTWGGSHPEFFASPHRLPYALLQCNGGVSERLCAYLNVHDTDNYSKSRILQVNHVDNPLQGDEQAATTLDADGVPQLGGAEKWRSFVRAAVAEAADAQQESLRTPGSDGKNMYGTRVPAFLYSVIQRVNFVNVARPFASLDEVVELLKVHHELLAAQLEDEAAADAADASLSAHGKALREEKRGYRTHRLLTFPRILEAKIKCHMTGAVADKARKTAAEAAAKDKAASAEMYAGFCAMKERRSTLPVWRETATGSNPPVEVATEREARTKAFRVGLVKDALAARAELFGEQVGRYEEYDQVCFCQGLYWVGLGVPRIYVPEEHEDMPSGAYWKLQEIRSRFLASESRIAQYSNRSVSVDIGASPGGWSYCCAKDFFTRHCFAVDPAGRETYHTLLDKYYAADYDAAVKEIVADAKARQESQILQVKQKGQDFLDTTLIANKIGVAIYVCDINDDLENAVEMAERVYKAGLLETPALVVLTFKNTVRSKGKFHDKKEKAKESLKLWLKNIREIHLFANTQLETTVVGEVF